jgi:ribokinase
MARSSVSTAASSSPGRRIGRVIVVGSVNVDLVVTTERLPGRGETVTGGRFARHPGGKGGNQAVAAARLGATTAFVGAVGDDAFGAEARAALEAEGVDVEGLLTLPGEATGVALIVVDLAGENSIAVAGGANAALGTIQVRAALRRLALTPSDVVLVGHEIRSGATHEALRLGRLAGATTILNPAPVGGLEPPTLALADILTPNEGELAALAGTDGGPAAAAKRLVGRDQAPRSVLVSLGARGAILVAGRQSTVIPAGHVEVKDSVGAGDTLNGALAADLAAGRPVIEAARRAVVAASLAVTKVGARGGMPTAAELAAAIDG